MFLFYVYIYIYIYIYIYTNIYEYIWLLCLLSKAETFRCRNRILLLHKNMHLQFTVLLSKKAKDGCYENLVLLFLLTSRHKSQNSVALVIISFHYLLIIGMSYMVGIKMSGNWVGKCCKINEINVFKEMKKRLLLIFKMICYVLFYSFLLDFHDFSWLNKVLLSN